MGWSAKSDREFARMASFGLLAKLPGLTLVPASSILALILSPVILPPFARLGTQFKLLCIVAFGCVPFGFVMRWLWSTELQGADLANTLSISLWVTAFAGIPALGVYLAELIGMRVVLRIGIFGALVFAAINDPALGWKGDVGIYTTLALLALTADRPLNLSRAVLAGSAAISAVSDARGQSAFALIALGATFTSVDRARSLLRHPARSLGIILIAGAGAAFGIYQAMLAGKLGAEAQFRTMEQSAYGNPILGARVEWAAATRVFANSPIGYGTGVITPSQVQVDAVGNVEAHHGDYTSTYFTLDVLGPRHDFHSTLVNLWYHFGILGVLLAAIMTFILATSIIKALASISTVGVVALYAFGAALWDQFFSPMADIDRMVTALFICACLHRGLGWDTTDIGATTQSTERPRKPTVDF